MEANLQSDFQVMEGFLRKVQEIIEAMNKDPLIQLSKKLLGYYNTHHKLEFRVVPKEYAEEVKNVLIQHGIPMMFSEDSAGNTVFMLPSDAEYHYSKYPDFYSFQQKINVQILKMPENSIFLAFFDNPC